MTIRFFLIYGSLIHLNCRKTIIEADDGRTIPVLTMGPIGIIPEMKHKGFVSAAELNRGIVMST